MAKIYTIVKKNTAKHVQAETKFGKTQVVNLGKHVMIPSQRVISYGHSVSHAKNKANVRRMPNLRVVHVMLDGMKKALRITAHDARTFKKLTAPKVEETV